MQMKFLGHQNEERRLQKLDTRRTYRMQKRQTKAADHLTCRFFKPVPDPIIYRITPKMFYRRNLLLMVYYRNLLLMFHYRNTLIRFYDSEASIIFIIGMHR